MTPYVQKLNIGARPKFSHLEDELMEWFTEAKGQLKIVTRFMIQVKTHFLTKKTSYQSEYPNVKNAKFSCKWVDNFMS